MLGYVQVLWLCDRLCARCVGYVVRVGLCVKCVRVMS